MTFPFLQWVHNDVCLGTSVVDDEIGLICYVCGWAQGFKLAYGTPPDITNNVYLDAILPNSSNKRLLVQSPELESLFSAASRPDPKHWIWLVSCYVHCHLMPCGHNNQPIRFKMGLIWVLQPQFTTTLLSSIHSVIPIILLTLTRILNDLENTFPYLDNFFLWPLASIFHKYGMIHMKSSTAHNI